jgi:Na+/melibiose symporter-like transporter
MRVPTLRLLAWCGPCLPVAALGLPLVVYLPPYYSGTLGLSLGTVGFLFALVRLVDIPLDPLLGALMDQTRSRYGQFRPWLVVGLFVLSLGVFLLFMEAPGVSAPKAFLNLFILYIGYSITFLAQTSWGSRLSGDYAERARIFGWWTAANVAGTILVLLVPPLVGSLAGAGDDSPARTIHAMGWYILALILPVMVAGALLIPEGDAPPAPHGLSLRAVRRLLADRRMVRLLALDLLLSLIPAITGALFLFFFTQVKAFTAQQASILLLFYFVSGLAAAPLWIRVATRLGKHRAVAISGAWIAAAQLFVIALPPGNLLLSAAGMSLAGIPFAAPAFLLRAMLADLNDALRLDSQEAGDPVRDDTGLSFALLTATAKLGYAVPIGLLYPLLGLFGFSAAPGAVNSDTALTALAALFVGPPLLCGAVAWVLARGWPIDAAAHAAISARLARAG